MHFMRLLAALALVCLPAPLLAGAELEARVWSLEMDGTIRVSEAGRGTEIQLPDRLGIDEDAATEVRLTWRLPGSLIIRFGYMPMSFSGNAMISEDIEFGGFVFPVAFDVASELDLDYARVGLGWLVKAGDGFRIGPIVELKGIRAEADLVGSVLAIPLVSASEAQDAGFVSVGLGFDAAPMSKLHIVGEVGYAPALEYGELLEAELGIKFSPIKVLSVFAGYRLMDLDLEVDDDTLGLELSGPYFGASLTF